MKKLIFVRHGKAEEPVSGITDFERSLTLKGKIVAGLMAGKLKELEKPGIKIISSPAFRAIETAIIFAGELGIKPDEILLNTSIYNRMSLKNLPGILAQAGEGYDTIMLFGHNPSFSDITASLCHEISEYMPKCGIAGLDFDTGEWSGIGSKKGKLAYYLKPEKIL